MARPKHPPNMGDPCRHCAHGHLLAIFEDSVLSHLACDGEDCGLRYETAKVGKSLHELITAQLPFRNPRKQPTCCRHCGHEKLKTYRQSAASRFKYLVFNEVGVKYVTERIIFCPECLRIAWHAHSQLEIDTIKHQKDKRREQQLVRNIFLRQHGEATTEQVANALQIILRNAARILESMPGVTRIEGRGGGTRWRHIVISSALHPENS